MPPDPKPRKRIRSAAGIAAMHEKVEAEGKCRLCPRRNRVWLTPSGKRRNTLTVHHIVGRDQGGDDVPENGAPLCGSGTTGCHGDVQVGREWAILAFRATMLPAEIDYVIERKGEWWLDTHYPDRRRK